MTGSSTRTAKVQYIKKFSIGALAGAGGALLFMELGGKSRIDFDDPGAILAVMAGLIYGLIGLFVGVGALVPHQGARFLNVEDAEEIREQRASLGPSAVSCILVGLFLLVLALASSIGNSVNRDVLAIMALACLAAVVVISLVTKSRTDELMRQISMEASALAMHVALVVLSVWATLAHLDYVGWMSPLALIAGLALLELLAIVWLSARKGLMAPR